MLTEYHNETEIVNELNIVCDKVNEIRFGWFGKKLNRLFIKNKKGGETFTILTINKQKYEVNVRWDSTYKNGYFLAIHTYIETNHGKITLVFYQKDMPIMVYSPHYRKRHHERCNDASWMGSESDIKPVKYERNCIEYELIDFDGAIAITRKSKIEPRIRYYITALNRDMCKSKNYQELLSRVGKQIDSDDIYKWK